MNQQKSVLTLLVALLCCVFSIKAQNAGQVTGKVVDTMGELSGVSIVVKGSTNGTVKVVSGFAPIDEKKHTQEALPDLRYAGEGKPEAKSKSETRRYSTLPW